MSKRRSNGEWVWLKQRGGCIGAPEVVRAEISMEDEPMTWCLYDCGDENCNEWPNLRAEREDGSRYWIYHVNECDMVDTREEATS